MSLGPISSSGATRICTAHWKKGFDRRRRMRGLLADAPRSPRIGSLVSRVWTTRFEFGQEVIERDVARGELRTDTPPATIWGTFLEPLHVRLLITDERIDNAFIEDVIEAGLDAARVAQRSE